MKHEYKVDSAHFSPDGQRVVTASWDNIARLWDAASGKALGEPMKHEAVRSRSAIQPRWQAGGDGLCRQHCAAVGGRQRQID